MAANPGATAFFMTSAPTTYLETGDVPVFKEKCHEPLTSADDRRDGAARIGANLTVVAMGVLAVVTEYAPARSTRFGMAGPLFDGDAVHFGVTMIFVGFFAKFSVLQAVVIADQIWLAIVAVFFSLVGAYYYLRVVKVMYFDPPSSSESIKSPLNVKLLLSVNGLAVAVLGIFPNGLLMLCAESLARSIPF